MLAVSSTAFSSANKDQSKATFDDYIDSLTDSDDSDSDSDSDSLDEDAFGGIFFENLITSLHSEEVNKLKKFYLEYVDGF